MGPEELSKFRFGERSAQEKAESGATEEQTDSNILGEKNLNTVKLQKF